MHFRRFTIASVLICALLNVGCASKKPTFVMPVMIYKSPVAQSSSISAQTSSATSQAVTADPPSVLIEVPFAPQAPFANWDPLHEEACEEMSLIMVHHFLEGTPLSLDDAEKELQAMIAWEQKHGYADDVSIEQLGMIASHLYGYSVRVINDVTAENLRHELANGHPVIIPVAGRELQNPYFSGAGPLYHMLVVTGYTEDGFITNDPGTKRGEQYLYKTDVLLSAIHDWVGVKEEIAKGPKKALVIEK